MKKMARRKPVKSPVDTYTERPYEEAKAEEGYFEAVEDRQPDQIADYHVLHPTLKPSRVHEADPPTDEPGDPVE